MIRKLITFLVSLVVAFSLLPVMAASAAVTATVLRGVVTARDGRVTR